MSDLPASLLDELDKKLIVLLRDGRTLIGYLRSIDQFSNLLLHQTIERIYVNEKYGDIPRGIFLIRGENVALCGEIDDQKELNTPLKQIPIEEILELQQNEIEERQRREKIKLKILKEKGFCLNLESINDDQL
ncbi:U6 snRNA-associated Sm-like protein LSm1 [Dermatophagoides pteronyssinus]|uniref:U6 snRNA-associated Sm-like protein LSm1 n=2 Tax=Dermatophagoides pteronyssinus TaxID=6956 RepID=A0A6P6XYT9_DERPT|nr:U6 snRNA-associated Sm-like protein LSm1 [Dermatophagoides pteronyssinus]KAH9416795.1 SM-like, degradation of cytoplasmic mRNAs and positively regulates transcription initiation [Dermatophagoides pteronyssinus]